MSKKGGAQQLQADINTDEELLKFLEKPGLLVLDVYSEWCGPCLAMVGSLRKIKLELGGDNLHLAVCKTDTIEAFQRFRNKSEPTWLFATQGKLVNLMFGTDVPKLMQLIAEELSLLGNTKRTFYGITELQPEERARRDVIENALAEAHRKEVEEAERQKLEYLTHVTDEIMTNLPDIGVTIFGPQVVRDTYKKLMEVAETEKIQCKDRRTAPLLPEHFDIINFACENPIDPAVLEHMYNKDLLIGFWKISDQDNRELQDIFLAYAHDLTQPRTVVSDGGESDADQVLPPILAPLEIKGVTLKLMNALHKIKSPVEDVTRIDDPLTELVGDKPLPGENTEIDEGIEAKETEPDVETTPSDEIASLTPSEPQSVLVPPIWVPTDRRTHATLIYVFFRPQTATFLPPDPVPDPPHVVMAFDAYKKKDIFDVIEKHQEDVLLYGFFSNDNPETATLIANSIDNYEKKLPQITDKLVLKVAKKTSHTMLTFATYGPSYVSTNTVIGKEEALRFFPEGYTTQDVVEAQVEVTKKKKKSKTKLAVQPEAEQPTDASALSPEESGEEHSGETAEISEQQTNSEN